MERYELLRLYHIPNKANEKKILHLVEENHKETYQYLTKYIEMVKEANPRGLCYTKWGETLTKGGNPVFERMLICFSGCKETVLAGCRKLTGVDGRHLKGPYEGILFTYNSLDVMQTTNVSPIAYAIVDQETKYRRC